MVGYRTAQAVLLAGFGFAVAAGPAAAEFREIEGTAGYGERTELPPEAVMEVQLLEISEGEAAPVPIASVSVRALGAEPYPFRLTYDDAMVAEDRDYALAARIALDGETVFETADATPVFTGLSDGPAHIRMVRPAPETSVQPQLENTDWVLAEMAAGELTPASRAEVSFGEEGAASGSGGCNSFRASYRIDPPQGLSFGEIAPTLRGCSAGIAQQERLVFRALGNTRSYRIDETGGLVLQDGEAAMLLRFERRR